MASSLSLAPPPQNVSATGLRARANAWPRRPSTGAPSPRSGWRWRLAASRGRTSRELKVARLFALWIVLVGYSLAAATLLVHALRNRSSDDRYAHWLDVGAYGVIVTFSGGPASTYYLGFLLPVFVASFRWRFGAGVRTLNVSLTVLLAATILGSVDGGGFEGGRFFLRAYILIIVGYLLASWGELDVQLKRGLVLLRDIALLSTPGFGTDRAIGALVTRVGAFYAATSCLLLMRDVAGPGHRLWKADSA